MVQNCCAKKVVRDSVRRLFIRLAGAVGRQSALHQENSGFAASTLGRHIFMFRGYRILLSIRNPSCGTVALMACGFHPIKNFQKCAVKILRTFFANYCHEKRVRERSNIYVSFRQIFIYILLYLPINNHFQLIIITNVSFVTSPAPTSSAIQLLRQSRS